jgi:PIN domain nuclease of toxin-antitoxin system
MSEAPLLDTHVWVWWLHGEPSLPARDRQRLDRLAAEGRAPYISDASLWEVQMLVKKERLRLRIPFADWIVRATAAVRPLRIGPEVVMCLHALPDSFHGDPVDRLITATAMAHRLTLATPDDRIVRSKVVPVWGKS